MFFSFFFCFGALFAGLLFCLFGVWFFACFLFILGFFCLVGLGFWGFVVVGGIFLFV